MRWESRREWEVAESSEAERLRSYRQQQRRGDVSDELAAEGGAMRDEAAVSSWCRLDRRRGAYVQHATLDKRNVRR